MTELVLDSCRRMVDQAIAFARETSLNPLAVVVLDARGALRAAAAEDGTSLARWKIALGKDSAALALGMGTRKIAAAAVERPHFLAGLTTVLSAGGFLGFGALALYGRDILHLYRARKRRTIELNSRTAAIALANLAAAAILIVILLAFGTLGRNVAAVVFLVSFGWLSGLGLAQLFKVVAFLTWLECYGPVLGKTATPRVQDLVVEHRAIKWFALYFLAVWAATATLLLGQPLTFRIAAAVMVIATGGIIVQLVRTRRLADVSAALRLPNGARAPRLLLPWNYMSERHP